VTTSVRVGVEPTTFRTARVSGWARRYAVRLAVTDAAAVALSVAAAHLLVLGVNNLPIGAAGGMNHVISQLPLSLGIAVVWILALRLMDTRGARVIGAGTTEYKRVVDASIATFAVFLVAAFFLDLDVSRLYATATFAIGTVAIAGSRWLWRQWLLAKRRGGHYSSRVVLIGSAQSVTHTALELSRNTAFGYHVVGVGLTDGPDSGLLGGTGLPIIGGIDDVPSLLDSYGADTVIATNSDHLPAERVREISWGLDPQRHQLMIAPSIADVAGSRVHLRPVAGLPLIHVETPQYEGPQRAAKRLFDVIGSGLILIGLLPLFLVLAIFIKRADGGPVFYTQDRVGRDGENFRILKFRSMYTDADARRAELVEALGISRGLFKMADDPRITPVGKILRKYSLDELPQLINVFRGDMSLVGPRPALPEEVSDYNSKERRRLVVTPGMSGLWQVSGRSNLAWEDGIRLDLYYVENWSMTGDLIILWRTAKTVLFPEGAY